MTEARLLTEVVPFGKYRGKPVDDLVGDHEYLNWCLNNLSEFVQQRYPELYPVLVNNGRRASETPRHNRLQALFLDDLYRQAFCQVARA